MSTTPGSGGILSHHVRQMGGRDPHEEHRVATPLELLFDLTFATCFSFAASQFAAELAEGRYAAALLGFGFASITICWAWGSFSWFSSAYDTDDWLFRLATMVQMIGVLVLAIGLPPMFASIERGQHLDNSVMVLGYVIMRVALLSQWLRAAKQDSAHRRVCLTYAITISIAQIGWVALILARWSTAGALILGAILVLIEFAGPVFAERKDGGTPWNAHHIVERHSLFANIALGEGVVGTVAALSAVVEQQGWTLDAALVGIAGTGLTFAMWWIYYMVPAAEVLERHRDRAFVWGYGQVLIVTAIVATGAGLHVAAYFIQHRTVIGPLATVLSVAIPVAAYIGLNYATHYYLVRRFYRLDVWLLTAIVAILVASVVAAQSGLDVAKCLVILILAPAIIVVGYEGRGYRYEGGT
ncbi:MAG TPA: low temperature requirement protein A [Gemmatimonadaceae bacterium]